MLSLVIAFLRESRARRAARALVAITMTGVGCTTTTVNGPDEPPGASDTVRIALTDMGTRTYLTYAGGLYPGGIVMPADHAARGVLAARGILPVDGNGVPAASGRIVLLSIGMSNTTQEFCGRTEPPCATWSFTGQALADGAVNHTNLAIIDGARGGQVASLWDSPNDVNYDLIRDTKLLPGGLSERQVQVVWVKVANARPISSLPAQDADAYQLVRQIGDIARALAVRYPNVKQVFLSSRIYGGYATTALNPEPYAYESGLAVKWLIAAQIEQMRQGRIIEPLAGDLSTNGVAPWLAWGPYLWADGTNGRSDGLIWMQSDFQSDGTHPSQSGVRKVGAMLLDFLKTTGYTRCWFLAGRTC